jgi:hypothetical protein
MAGNEQIDQIARLWLGLGHAYASVKRQTTLVLWISSLAILVVKSFGATGEQQGFMDDMDTWNLGRCVFRSKIETKLN